MFRNIAYPAFLIFAGLCFVAEFNIFLSLCLIFIFSYYFIKHNIVKTKVVLTIFLLFLFSYFTNSLYYNKLNNNVNKPVLFSGIILNSTAKEHFITGKFLCFKLNKYNGNFLSFLKVYDYTIPKTDKILKGMFVKGSGLIKEKTTFKNTKTDKTNFYKARNSFYYISIPSTENQKLKKSFYFDLLKLIDKIKIPNNHINSSILKAIISGDKSEIPYNLKIKLQNSGIYHLFVVSGLHFGIFFSFIYFMLSLIPIRKKYKYGISLFFLIILLLVNTFSPSTVRAFSMLFIYFLFNTFDIEIKPIDAVGLAGISMLTLNFYHPFDPGFLLSFLVTGGIINSIDKNDKIIKTVTTIPFVAFFISFPIILAYFSKFNIISPITNIIATPFVSITIYSYIISLTQLPFFIELTNFLINCLIYFSEFGSKFSYSYTFNIYLSYLLLIIAGFFSLYKFTPKKVLLFVFLITLNISINQIYKPKENYLLVPDTSQSQSILLKNSNNTILIDTGTHFSSIAAIIPTLKYRNIKKINHLFLSHFDSDHGGGLINILENFQVENIYFPYFDKNSKNFIKCYSKIKEKNIKLIKVKSSDIFQIDRNLVINVLNPPKSIKYKSSNESSMALFIKFFNKTITIPGDLDGKALLKASNLFKKTDILIAPHHGSKKAAINKFAKITKPKTLIICAGKYNRFNFPSKEFLKLYKNSNIWITGQNGEFILKF